MPNQLAKKILIQYSRVCCKEQDVYVITPALFDLAVKAYMRERNQPMLDLLGPSDSPAYHESFRKAIGAIPAEECPISK